MTDGKNRLENPEDQPERLIHPSHEMTVVSAEIITVCKKCHLCECHNLVDLAEPCSPSFPEK